MLGQIFRQQRRLVALGDEMHALLDLFRRLARRVHGHPDRIGQVGIGQFLHQLRHGGRKQQRLAVLGQHPRDLAQRVDKADVQHLVGLVQHQIGGGFQADRATLDQVHQTARRGDQHIDAARQPFGLHVDRGAADDAERPDRRAFGIGVEIGGDLGGQFAGRRQDQCAAGPGIGLLAVVDQPGQHRQPEGRRLAGAGLRQSQHVAALDHGGDRLGLDRGGRGQPHRGDIGVDAVVDAHLGKGAGGQRIAGGRPAAFVGVEMGRCARFLAARGAAGILLVHQNSRPRVPRIGRAAMTASMRGVQQGCGRDTGVPASLPA